MCHKGGHISRGRAAEGDGDKQYSLVLGDNIIMVTALPVANGPTEPCHGLAPLAGPRGLGLPDPSPLWPVSGLLTPNPAPSSPCTGRLPCPA